MSTNQRRALLTVAVVLSLAAAPPASAEIHGASRCSDVYLYVNGALYTRTHGLKGIRVACHRARRVAGRYLHGAEGNVKAQRPFGYACANTGRRVICRKGHKRVEWHW
jgi:hypothetical protein